jgi:hypothetical protein
LKATARNLLVFTPRPFDPKPYCADTYSALRGFEITQSDSTTSPFQTNKPRQTHFHSKSGLPPAQFMIAIRTLHSAMVTHKDIRAVDSSVPQVSPGMPDAPRFVVTITITAVLAALVTLLGLLLVSRFSSPPPPIGGQAQQPAGLVAEPQTPSPASHGDFFPTI